MSIRSAARTKGLLQARPRKKRKAVLRGSVKGSDPYHVQCLVLITHWRLSPARWQGRVGQGRAGRRGTAPSGEGTGSWQGCAPTTQGWLAASLPSPASELSGDSLSI